MRRIPHADVCKAQCWAAATDVFSLPQMWRQLPTRKHLSSAGTMALAYFIAGLCCMLILARVRPNLTGGIYLCPEGIWRANRLFVCSVGILAVPRGALLSGDPFFRVRTFTDAPDCLFIDKCTGNVVGASTLLWIVTFDPARITNCTASGNFGGIAAGSVCVVLAMMMFQKLDAFSSTFLDLLGCPCGAVKTPY